MNRFWNLAVILLVAVIITGSLVIWSKYSPGQPVEITIAPRTPFQGDIYVGDAVNSPGFYPFRPDDSVGGLIQAAGGARSDADLGHLKLYIPGSKAETPQKVNINRADTWLLQALPGIGETRAQAIVSYRRQNGPFRDIDELMKVEGIGATTYERIKPLITVAD